VSNDIALRPLTLRGTLMLHPLTLYRTLRIERGANHPPLVQLGCQPTRMTPGSQSTSGERARAPGSHLSAPAAPAGGMNGSLLPAAGEPCPAVVPAPFALGDDIMANSVCCACFRNPPHQRYVPRLLDGQVPEARCPPGARAAARCWGAAW